MPDLQDIDDSQDLRTRAELLQHMGLAPVSHGHVLSANTLSVLYKLSGSPESTSDSLKILHELQTHQIELDLLQEQHDANALEATAELSRYRMLYEYAPVGYLVVSQTGRIIDSNRAAATLLATTCGALVGNPLEDFLSSGSRAGLSWQLQKLFSGSTGETCILQADSTPTRALRVFACHAPHDDVALVMLTNVERTAPN